MAARRKTTTHFIAPPFFCWFKIIERLASNRADPLTPRSGYGRTARPESLAIGNPPDLLSLAFPTISTASTATRRLVGSGCSSNLRRGLVDLRNNLRTTHTGRLPFLVKPPASRSDRARRKNIDDRRQNLHNPG